MGDTVSTEHKLTPTERLHEVTMAAVSRQPTPPESSVELTRNAKGDVQISVTARGWDAAEAAATAQRLFDSLCAFYPRSDTNPTTKGDV